MKTKLKIALLALVALTLPLNASNEPSSEAVVNFANEATTEQLQEVKGIGTVIASRIIAARPFTMGESIERVKGIGTVIASRIEEHAKDIRD